MDKWLDFIRGCVRPVLTVSGFGTVLFLTIRLALEFANEQIALALVGLVTGSVTTMMGFWFRGRVKGEGQ